MCRVLHGGPMNERERIVRTLNGERTDLLPWTTRLDMWFTARVRTGTMPAEMEGLDLMAVHRLLEWVGGPPPISSLRASAASR